ncbi:unnamed protein product [Mytilus coruscus]|uniref:Integrase catalytic domain-containing protein n=1 Tax=Mytilus coruscus TaxID=42192 RepID=A0A6J8D5A5_MYTCO|nr:unnamed protein product [Mytilus coruscus]
MEVNACETDLEVDNKGDEDLESVELELFYGDYTLLALLDPGVVNSELLDIPAVGQLQQVDPDFQDMFNYLQNDVLPQSEKVRQKVLAESQDFSVCDGVLYKWFQKRFKTSENEKYIKQLCLPLALRRHALLAYHDLNYGGAHLGLDRVLAALRQTYFWPKMHQTVKDHVLSCDRCQQIKVDHTRKNPPLNPLPLVGPFDRWHMDFLKLSKTNKGEKYLLVLVDSYSKWVEAFAMKTQEASEVAKVLFKEVFSRFGAARFFVSDRGKSFMNNLVLSLCEILDVTRYHTSSYHPQTNGLVERCNSTLIKSFRAYCDKAQNNSPDKLPGILMALRNSPSTQSTEFSPFHSLFGREMNLPFDTSVTPKQNLSSDAKLQMEEVLSNLKITQDFATKNMLERQLKSKERYDRNSKIPQFKVRDLVLLRQHVVPVGRSQKLVDKYKGPYYITELGPNYTYKLRMCSTNKEDPRDHQLQPDEVVQNQAKNDADRVDQHDQSNENVPQAQNRENETTDGHDDQVEDHQFYKAEKLLKLKRLQARMSKRDHDQPVSTAHLEFQRKRGKKECPGCNEIFGKRHFENHRLKYYTNNIWHCSSEISTLQKNSNDDTLKPTSHDLSSSAEENDRPLISIIKAKIKCNLLALRSGSDKSDSEEEELWDNITIADIDYDFKNVAIATISTAFPASVCKLYRDIGFKKDNFTKYVICKKCYKLYDYEDCVQIIEGQQVSKTCQNIRFPNHPQIGRRKVCGELLLKVVQLQRKRKLYPYKTFCYKSLESSVSSLVHLPEFENNCEKWRSRRQEDGFLADVYDGRIWKEFQGHGATLGCSKCMKTFPGDIGKKIYGGFDVENWIPRNLFRQRQLVHVIRCANTQTEKDILESKYGLRYSPLWDLDYFDPIRMSIIDPIHNLYQGTAKKLIKIWLELKILLPEDLKTVQERVDSVNAASNIGAIPRKISSSFGGFTAEQWKNWTNVFCPYFH